MYLHGKIESFIHLRSNQNIERQNSICRKIIEKHSQMKRCIDAAFNEGRNYYRRKVFAWIDERFVLWSRFMGKSWVICCN